MPQSNGQSIESRLLNLIQQDLLLTPPGFSLDSDLFAAGLDSMAIMQLLLLMEEEFQVVIPAESVSRENFKTTRAVATLIRERKNEPLQPEDRVDPVEEISEDTPLEIPDAAPVSAEFKRLPLRHADYFVVGFDQMLRGHGQMGHIAHSFLELDRLPDVEALQQLVAELPGRFPLLNARLRRPLLVDLPKWEPAKKIIPLQLKLWSQEGSAGELLKKGGSSFKELQLLLEDLVNKSLPRHDEGWENAGFELVEKTDGGAVFIFSWSHLIMDGVGAEMFLQELHRIARGLPQGAIPPFSDHDEIKQTPLKERFQAVAPMIKRFYSIMEKRHECLGSREIKPAKTRFQVLTLTKAQTEEALRRSSAVSGPLINMPFHLACAMRAHWRVFEHRGKLPGSLMSCVPIQVRRKGAAGPIFQNQLTMFFGTLDKEDLATLDSATRVLQEQHTQYLKNRLGDAFQHLMWLMRPMPPGLHMKFIQFQMKGLFTSFYHSNTGVFAPGLDDFTGAKVSNAYHVPGISSPPGTGVFANEKHGRLVLTLCWKDGSLTEEERAIFMKQILSDMGADGE